MLGDEAIDESALLPRPLPASPFHAAGSESKPLFGGTPFMGYLGKLPVHFDAF